MPKVFTSKTQKLGKLAEDAVAQYLASKGFTIVEQNYTRKSGEIDIIALENKPVKQGGNVSHETNQILHFVEVKSVSRVTFEGGVEPKLGEFRPEDNMHPKKVKRLKTTMETYLMSFRNDEKNHKRHLSVHKGHVENGVHFQFDLVVVYVNTVSREMIIKPLWNIIL